MIVGSYESAKRNGRPIVLIAPKFELTCKCYGGTNKTFVLKNVSSLIVSNIRVEEFALIYVDRDCQNLITMDIKLPTSLGPNEAREFTFNHRTFDQRGVGYKEFRFVFTAEDEYLNEFRCVATKNVQDRREYILGVWDTNVTLVKKDGREITNMDRPTVFISYNWDSDKTADEVENRLSPIATILRDKSSIGPWGSISEFMNRIRTTDLVVVILSDAYLKSVACLYEIMQLLKDDNWVLHSMFLVENSAKGIYEPIGQLDYVDHWENKRQNLEKALEGKNPALVTSQAEDLKKIQLIQLHINKFMKSVADRNNPDLAKAIDAIERRIQSNSREAETEGDIRQQELKHPVFDVKIIALNKQVTGTAVVGNFWSKEPLPKHKNVRIQVELFNNAIIRSLKVFGRIIENGIVKQSKPIQLTVCYMESPDVRWKEHVIELSRDPYPAGEDGIPIIVPLEYTIDYKQYRQVFKLGDNHVYFPGEQEEIVSHNIDKTIQMKNCMRKDFLKPASELKKYTREEIWKNPEKRFISDEVIIISIECKDPKWNTDGGFGKYEIYDFCDEGLLCWDNTGFKAQVKYYNNKKLVAVSANRMLCLPFEKVIAYDLNGNSSYNMPIIYANYQIGKTPFKFYYRDITSGEIIDNGVVTEANAES